MEVEKRAEEAASEEVWWSLEGGGGRLMARPLSMAWAELSVEGLARRRCLRLSNRTALSHIWRRRALGISFLGTGVLGDRGEGLFLSWKKGWFSKELLW